MTMTDPIADMLTRIRNAVRNDSEHVDVPASKLKSGIAEVLKREGYITSYEAVPGNVQGVLRLELKYGPDGESVIERIQRESKPGRREFTSVGDIKRVRNGIGISIYTTSAGVLSDRECREKNVGGEKLATVW